MTSTGVVLILLGLFPFAVFSWGVKGHFRSTGAMPTGMRLISVLSLAAFIWFVFRLLISPPAAAWPLAVLLYAMALAIFGWSVSTTRQGPPTLAFDRDQPSLLYREGPYRYVRHPFYLSYLLFWAGTAIATRGVIGWAAPVVMLLVYAGAARREERKFAHSALASAYTAYKTRAGMFFPRLSAFLPG